jgi:molybdopterin molybdotransferase
MLPWQQARAKVIEVVRARMNRPHRETLRLERTLGRVLAQPVACDRDQPAFHRSTRDGFAVRSADAPNIPAEFAIVGEIKAGSSFSGTLGPGQALRIMTGAPVPEDADAVVMVEHTRPAGDDRIVVDRPVRAGQHIVARGSEARAGQKLLEPGCRIGFPELALLAQVGAAKLKTYLQPRVAVLSTGDEIVPVDEEPGPFAIRDTNSLSLAAQVRLAGARPVPLGRAPDIAEVLDERIRQGLGADVLLLSGGVSMGKYDLVETVLSQMGAEFFFDGLAIRPGRPAVFGWCGGRPVFGLPGNPVSTMVTFELLVTPALDLLGGTEPRPLPLVSARLAEPLDESEGLTHFLPARLTWSAEGISARPVPWRGSGDLAGLSQSNGFIVVPADRPRWQVGETIEVLLRRDAL